MGTGYMLYLRRAPCQRACQLSILTPCAWRSRGYGLAFSSAVPEGGVGLVFVEWRRHTQKILQTNREGDLPTRHTSCRRTHREIRDRSTSMSNGGVSGSQRAPLSSKASASLTGRVLVELSKVDHDEVKQPSRCNYIRVRKKCGKHEVWK
jgi:hypothetical protein